MKYIILFIFLLINLSHVSAYGGWLDQFIETKQYAEETARQLKSANKVRRQNTKNFFSPFGRWRSINRTEIHAIIRQASRRHGVDQNFIKAVITAESSFKNHSLSSKGAMGLMQLMPSTCKDLGVTDPWDPKQNINGGTSYLKTLLLEFKNPHKALAAYNFGPGKVRRKARWPKETRVYVKRVMKNYKRYSRQL